MAVAIKKKITAYAVVTKETKAEASAPAAVTQAAPAAPAPQVISMHEKLERPEVLRGSTYKIKSPIFEHAMYVTINDVILNPGTEFEESRPFEIFVNSKNMEQFQWVVALTRVMSAVFRKGGDVTFLVEELRAVFDPRGGYWKPGGVFSPSLVADLGMILETHLKSTGVMHDPEMSDAQRALIAEKRAAFKKAQAKEVSDLTAITEQTIADKEQALADAHTDAHTEASESFPEGATMCAKCMTKAVILLDGCQTCLSCGTSKCG